MHERVIATEMKLDISIQIAVDHALVKKSEEIAEWTTQVANINEYVSINAAKPGNSSERMLIFFSIKASFFLRCCKYSCTETHTYRNFKAS